MKKESMVDPIHRTILTNGTNQYDNLVCIKCGKSCGMYIPEAIGQGTQFFVCRYHMKKKMTCPMTGELPNKMILIPDKSSMKNRHFECISNKCQYTCDVEVKALKMYDDLKITKKIKRD